MKIHIIVCTLGLHLALAGAASAFGIHPGTISVNHHFGKYIGGAEHNGYWLGHDYAFAGPSAIGFDAGNTIYDSSLGDVRDGSWVQDYSGPWGLVDQTWNNVGALWDLGGKSRVVDVFPFIDHVDGNETALLEGTEFRVFGSNDLHNWTAATLNETWAQGYNASTIYDDYTSRWGFGGAAYRYVGIESGNWETLFDSADCEIDAVARPVPEPASMLLLGSGVAGLLIARRRRHSVTS